MFGIYCKDAGRAEALSRALIAAKASGVNRFDINGMSCYFFRIPPTPVGGKISNADAEVKNLMVDGAIGLKLRLSKNVFKLKTLSLRDDLTAEDKKEIIASNPNVLEVSTRIPNNMRSSLNADFLDRQGAACIICITIKKNHDSVCNIPVNDDGLVDPKFLLHFVPKHFFEVQEVEVVGVYGQVTTQRLQRQH